jgi:periplasmic protein TonB
MAANAEIYFEHDHLGLALVWSIGLHIGITAALIIFPTILFGTVSQGWGTGGTGESIGANLVSSVPLPANPQQTQNLLANQSKGLTQSQPKVQEQDQDAIAIQGKKTKIKPKKPETVTQKAEEPPPEEDTNQVAFGEGGPVSGPYGNFAAPGTKGGFGVNGEGGDFGTRYAWYVRVVAQKVHDNWLAYEVDPRIKQANRFYLAFDITRDGRPGNVRIEQSSGVPSLDLSAVRAIQRIDTFGPLPSDYAGSKVSVEFWFDYDKGKM